MNFLRTSRCSACKSFIGVEAGELNRDTSLAGFPIFDSGVSYDG